MEDEVENINTLSLPLHPPWERYGWFKNLLSTSGGQSAAKKQLYWYFTLTKTASFFYLWTTMVRTSLCFEHGTLRTRTPTCSPKVPRLRTILYSPPPHPDADTVHYLHSYVPSACKPYQVSKCVGSIVQSNHAGLVKTIAYGLLHSLEDVFHTQIAKSTPYQRTNPPFCPQSAQIPFPSCFLISSTALFVGESVASAMSTLVTRQAYYLHAV